MEHLLALFNQFNAYAKANPILAGAVSLWGLGVVTWAFRSVPLKFWGLIKRQFTTSLQLTNATTGRNLENFSAFMAWFERSKWAKLSRTLSYSGTYGTADNPDEMFLGVGEGTHYFMYKGRFFHMRREKQQIANSYGSQQACEVIITMFGRKRQVILDMIEDFRYRPPQDKLGIYQLGMSGWERIADIPKRKLSSVIVPAKVKNAIVATIDEFLKSRSWYYDRGLPYKLTFVLYGIHGTGKTSFIKALAGFYGYNICQINLALMSDNSLEKALACAPDKSLILIEDFDSAHATQARKSAKREEDRKPADVPLSSSSSPTPVNAPTFELTLGNDLLTLSGVLNALDGVVSLDNKLIFMTTNVFETLDPALIRKGRVDFAYELGPLEQAEIEEYIRTMFPNEEICPNNFAPILGCNLQALYYEHRHDVEAFIESIPRVAHTPTRLSVVEA